MNWSTDGRQANPAGPGSRVRTKIRCAIYTRKSTEEGLEQEFNSLDAQRESAQAFIESQRHEGWVCLPERYDDGGFSGGNMDRPALKRLFADIETGRIDCVVVYKVDRMSRAILDFAKIIDLFDQHKVSFVSVTRARITQIMNLLHLAPDIQEDLLFLPRTTKGRDSIRETDMRPIAATAHWSRQRKMWKHLKEVRLGDKWCSAHSTAAASEGSMGFNSDLPSQ